MQAAERALAAKASGSSSEAKKWFEKAFRLEKQVADAILSMEAPEPSRCAILSSTATLATDCENYREAERYVAAAIAGNPPSGLMDELRELSEKIQFQWHLHRRGFKLSDSEIEMSLIAGESVSRGLVETKQFVKRVEALDKLIRRTHDRIMSIPFRSSGPSIPDENSGVEVYLSAAMAASYSVKARLGYIDRDQLRFQSMDRRASPAKIVSEVVDCISYISEGMQSELKERIADESYYNSFVGLAGALGPDEKHIKMMDIRTEGKGVSRQISIAKPLRLPKQPGTTSKGPDSFIGRIRRADETEQNNVQPSFWIQSDSGTLTRVQTRPGQLQDVVSHYWGAMVRVMVTYTSKGKTPTLDQILLDTEPDQ